MPRFLCLQRRLPAPASDPPSPTEMQELYGRFAAWRDQFRDRLPDLGGRLGAGTVVADPSTDGPFVEVKELIGGYMVVQADDLAEAARIASACPGLVSPGSGVEVIEILGP